MNYLDTGTVEFDSSIGVEDQSRYYQSLNMFVENLMYLTVSDKLFTGDFDYQGRESELCPTTKLTFMNLPVVLVLLLVLEVIL
ncbi:unnamed protein product [[Candida] boidinii]|nr:unnamed protein product [[Candida] boidinii]